MVDIQANIFSFLSWRCQRMSSTLVCGDKLLRLSLSNIKVNCDRTHLLHSANWFWGNSGPCSHEEDGSPLLHVPHCTARPPPDAHSHCLHQHWFNFQLDVSCGKHSEPERAFAAWQSPGSLWATGKWCCMQLQYVLRGWHSGTAGSAGPSQQEGPGFESTTSCHKLWQVVAQWKAVLEFTSGLCLCDGGCSRCRNSRGLDKWKENRTRADRMYAGQEVSWVTWATQLHSSGSWRERLTHEDWNK